MKLYEHLSLFADNPIIVVEESKNNHLIIITDIEKLNSNKYNLLHDCTVKFSRVGKCLNKDMLIYNINID